MFDFLSGGESTSSFISNVLDKASKVSAALPDVLSSLNDLNTHLANVHSVLSSLSDLGGTHSNGTALLSSSLNDLSSHLANAASSLSSLNNPGTHLDGTESLLSSLTDLSNHVSTAASILSFLSNSGTHLSDDISVLNPLNPLGTGPSNSTSLSSLDNSDININEMVSNPSPLGNSGTDYYDVNSLLSALNNLGTQFDNLNSLLSYLNAMGTQFSENITNGTNTTVITDYLYHYKAEKTTLLAIKDPEGKVILISLDSSTTPFTLNQYLEPNQVNGQSIRNLMQSFSSDVHQQFLQDLFEQEFFSIVEFGECSKFTYLYNIIAVSQCGTPNTYWGQELIDGSFIGVTINQFLSVFTPYGTLSIKDIELSAIKNLPSDNCEMLINHILQCPPGNFSYTNALGETILEGETLGTVLENALGGTLEFILLEVEDPISNSESYNLGNVLEDSWFGTFTQTPFIGTEDSLSSSENYTLGTVSEELWFGTFSEPTFNNPIGTEFVNINFGNEIISFCGVSLIRNILTGNVYLSKLNSLGTNV